MIATRIIKPLIIAGILAATTSAAHAVDVRKLELTMPVAGKPYNISAEPFSNWQLASEGQVSLDHRFAIQPDGKSGLIQVKIAPGARAMKQPINPCGILAGLSQTLKKNGIKLSPGRKPQANMMPVCSMIAETSLKSVFYYSAAIINDDLLIAGVARNDKDLTDNQLNEFARYLVSIKLQPAAQTQ